MFDSSVVASIAFRLRQWPPLAMHLRTAALLQTLSRMTLSPVTRQWFASHSGLSAADADRLLDQLTDDGFVESIDVSRFRDSGH